MRPLLASLALLLLALSRSTNSDGSVATSAAAPPDFMNPAAVMKILMELGGSFAAAIAYAPPGQLPKHIQKVMTALKTQVDNTVLCQLADTTSADRIKKALYEDKPRSDDEEKHSHEFGINCATTVAAEKQLDEWKCFCTEKKVILYCILHKYKREKIPATLTAPGACQKAAIDTLKNAGTKELAKFYNYGDLDALKNQFNDKFLKLYSENDAIASSQEMINVLCDATDPQVKTAVETLFKFDFTYAFMEKAMFVGLVSFASGNTDHYAVLVNIEKKCADSKFQDENTFNKCICEQDKGFSYCLFKFIGQAYKDTGYLKCDGPTKSVDPSKKPAVKPSASILPKVAGEGSNGGGSHSNRGENYAASTSSLLVPLAATAAMLLRPWAAAA